MDHPVHTHIHTHTHTQTHTYPCKYACRYEQVDNANIPLYPP